jgi:3-hydroxybutyryl-CoA dehydrogenase
MHKLESQSMNERQALSVPRHVTVVGAGIMGCDIAAIFVAAGADVTAIATSSARQEERVNHVRRSVEQLATGKAEGKFALVNGLDAAPLRETDLIVETVPEDLALKRRVFEQLEQLASANVPIASNASGFPISAIAGHLDSASRTAGLHFFLPAHVVPVVEVVKGERTSDATMDFLFDTMRAVGRVPVRVKRDTPGFLANRIQHALMREVFSILDEDLASPEDVDAAVRYGFGFRYVAAGPLMQKEFAGLDTQLAAATSIYPALSKSSEPSRTLTSLVANGRTGAKSLHGFWDWDAASLQAAKSAYEKTLLEALSVLTNSTAGGASGS